MNKATQELTASLQDITARIAEKSAVSETPLPNKVAAAELEISKEIESFIERSQSFSAEVRPLKVGHY
jgi:hypothetical protein